jgi:hypothetical protein
VNVGSTWGPTAWNFFAKDNITCGPFDMFALDLWQTSTLGLIESSCKLDLSRGYYRSTIINELGNLQKAAGIQGPKFVFAHFMLPHPPFVFTADGAASDVRVISFSWQKDKSYYLEQSKFCERVLVKTLEETIKHAGNDAIFVVQSDHGPGFARQKDEDEATYSYHHMRIFNAFKVPPDISLPSPTSPVNTFRYLFDKALGYDFPLQDNRSLMSTYEQPYQYTDITQMFQKSAGGAVAPAAIAKQKNLAP